jgi:hypothetical protein
MMLPLAQDAAADHLILTDDRTGDKDFDRDSRGGTTSPAGATDTVARSDSDE